MTDQTWRDHAACLDTDPAAFFPEGQDNDVSYAKRVCQRCPINAMIGCAREALAIEATDVTLVGVWAGIRVAQSSSSRIKALEDISVIAGVPRPETPATTGRGIYPRPEKKPRPCDRCHRGMRHRNTTAAENPGTVRHRGQGLCDSCHRITFGATSSTRIQRAAVAA